MSKRVTIMIDDDIHIKLRKIQASNIARQKNPTSFSAVINNVIRKSFTKK